MTILFDSTLTVNPASQTFGRGIAPPRTTHFEPGDEDRAWAAEFFDRLEQARYQEERNLRPEEQALEAAWSDQFNDTLPSLTGHCLNSGDRCDDLTFQGLCDRCDTIASEASIACINGLHGLGHRVF
jgi:hypothetical protein